MKEIQITFNGQNKSITTKTLDQLLQELHVETKYLAVAINNKVVPSAEYKTTSLNERDCVEVIRPVCGGC